MEKETVIIKEPKRTNKLVIVLIVVFTTVLTVLPIIAFIGLIFFVDYFDTNFKENKYGEIIVDGDAKIYNVSGYYDNISGNYYVQGYLENYDDDKIDSVFIEYLVYDKNNVLLGTAYASVDNLSANTKWKFKAIYDDIDSDEVYRYELSSVELY